MADRLRAPVQWYGGKGPMVAKLSRHVPLGGRPYCEPYMGAASLLFARPPAPVEVVNDLNGDLVNLFRCLQDRHTYRDLRHRLRYTLYARAEFGRALDLLASDERDPVLRAWAFFVAQNQSFSGTAGTIGNWSRTFVSYGGCAATVNKWLMRLAMLDAWHQRLLLVQIEHRDALEAIRYWDTPETVFYVDPPYHHDTRRKRQVYAVEPDHDHHVRLVKTLLACQGAVVLSGYDHPVYAALADAGWSVTRYETACSAAGRVRGSALRGTGAARHHVPRTEVVWANPRAVAACRHSPPLFPEPS
jgi:DNA adenine methylase